MSDVFFLESYSLVSQSLINLSDLLMNLIFYTRNNYNWYLVVKFEFFLVQWHLYQLEPCFIGVCCTLCSGI